MVEHEGGLVKPSSLSALAAAEAIAKENKVSFLLAGSRTTLHKAAEHAASSHPLVNDVLLWLPSVPLCNTMFCISVQIRGRKLCEKESRCTCFLHQLVLLHCRFLLLIRTCSPRSYESREVAEENWRRHRRKKWRNFLVITTLLLFMVGYVLYFI